MVVYYRYLVLSIIKTLDLNSRRTSEGILGAGSGRIRMLNYQTRKIKIKITNFQKIKRKVVIFQSKFIFGVHHFVILPSLLVIGLEVGE